MKKNLITIFSDNRLNKFLWTNVIIILIFIVAAVWKWSFLPPQLPLFYSLPRGKEQLGTPFELLILPLLTVIFSFVNLAIASLLYEEEKLISIISIAMSTTISILLFISFLRIVFLVS